MVTPCAPTKIIAPSGNIILSPPSTGLPFISVIVKKSKSGSVSFTELSWVGKMLVVGPAPLTRFIDIGVVGFVKPMSSLASGTPLGSSGTSDVLLVRSLSLVFELTIILLTVGIESSAFAVIVNVNTVPEFIFPRLTEFDIGS